MVQEGTAKVGPAPRSQVVEGEWVVTFHRYIAQHEHAGLLASVLRTYSGPASWSVIKAPRLFPAS